jgi:iron(III) transport system permease protein
VTKRLFLTLVVLLFAIIGVLPLLFMLFKSVMADGELNLSIFTEILATGHQWVLMYHSLTLAFAVALLSTLVGFPLGILFGKTDLPFRRFFTVLFTIPLLIPPYIFAISWSGLPVGVNYDSFFGLLGCITVLFSVFLPIPMLLAIFFLHTVNPRLEEAGLLAASWKEVMAEITLPLLAPAAALSFMLVFILSFGEFSVANFLRYDVYPVESFTLFAAFYDTGPAIAAALPLAGAALLFLLAEELFFRKRSYRPYLFSRHEILTLKLGPLRRWLFPAVAVLGFVVVIAPMIVLLVNSGGLENYLKAFRMAGDSMLRSLEFAATTATLMTFFGFFIGYLVHTKALAVWRVADAVTIFLFALPGTVIGISLISLWNTPWTNIVYATPLIVIFGLLAKYTALAGKISAVWLAQIPSSMEEAAQVAGAGWFRRVIFIVIPLMWRGVAVAWIAGYIFSLRDTSVTMLVYPPGQDTLAVRIFTLMANGSDELIAALCVIMITITLLPAALLWPILKTTAAKVSSWQR